MNQTLFGLREGALTLTYNAILVARRALRQTTRPVLVGVRVLVPRRDGVLLVRHRGGPWPWGLPGGSIDRGETLAQAAVREVYEESGCRTTPSHLLGVYHSFGEGMTNIIAVLVCDPLGEASPPVGDLEIVDARFFRPGDEPARTDPGSLRRIAEHARGERGLSGPWHEL
jgi:ADP-ribose pyrophosphatase YjhB (NUDIX family)